MVSGTWTLSQFSASYPKEVWESFVDWHVTAAVMIGALSVTLSYATHHYFRNSYSAEYQKLPDHQQLVVVQHSIEALTLSTLFAPLTYLMLSLNFEKQVSLEIAAKKVQSLGSLMFIIIIMYPVELATRYKGQRPLVLVHHLCAYANFIFPAFFLTTANMRAASPFVYFITYKAISFVGLIMYRLHRSNKWTSRIIFVGMLAIGLSRPLQVILILGSLMFTWDELVIWHAGVQIFFCALFTILQIYSLTIHYKMYKKCRQLLRKGDDLFCPSF